MGHEASLKTKPVENIQGGREVGSLDTGDEQQFNRFLHDISFGVKWESADTIKPGAADQPIG